MEELKIKSWDNFFNLIYVEANSFQLKYIFVEIKNFKTTPTAIPFQRHHLKLNDCLDLKQFKIGILNKVKL
jgi:hypothetical protein